MYVMLTFLDVNGIRMDFTNKDVARTDLGVAAGATSPSSNRTCGFPAYGFPSSAFPVAMDSSLSLIVKRILYAFFFLSNPRPPHVRPREAVEAVVRHFAVVGVRELQSVVPLALPVEESRHALQHMVVHLAEGP